VDEKSQIQGAEHSNAAGRPDVERSDRRERCCIGSGGAGSSVVCGRRWPSAAVLRGGPQTTARCAGQEPVVLSICSRRRARSAASMARKASASEPLRRVEKVTMRSKPVCLNGPGRAWGIPPTAQVVSGMEWREPGPAAGVERVNLSVPAPPTATSGAVLACGRRWKARDPSGRNREGQSSDAGHRGGPARGSDDAR